MCWAEPSRSALALHPEDEKEFPFNVPTTNSGLEQFACEMPH